MKQSLFKIVYLSMIITYGYISQSFAQDNITSNILQQINTNPSPRESLVQWYYSMDDFYAKIAGLS